MSLNLEELVDGLKAIAEPSRLRILKLLDGNDLTVSDLTNILGQSQPRVSRHLKLLLEAGLIHRWQEGSWALFRVNPTCSMQHVLHAILTASPEYDEVIGRDRERLLAVKQARRERASEYFSANAKSWDEIRSLHVPDRIVEKKLLDVVGEGPFHHLLDIGTGTGRILELLAPHYRSATGIDSNRDMLNVARSNLDAAQISNAEVRHADVYNLSLGRDRFDLIIIHQVLHFLDDPQAAIREAERALAPGGTLIVVDFEAHDHEFLRDQHQHQRLGFETAMISQWLEAVGLAANEQISITSDPLAGGHKPLSVAIWSARDTRQLIADEMSQQRIVA